MGKEGKEKPKMYDMHVLDLGIYAEIYELALKHGKKEGDSLQEEFEEVMKKYPEKFKYIGCTKMDKDLLLGNLREEHAKEGKVFWGRKELTDFLDNKRKEKPKE